VIEKEARGLLLIVAAGFVIGIALLVYVIATDL